MRLYTGEDGQSHVVEEELALAPVDAVTAAPAQSVVDLTFEETRPRSEQLLGAWTQQRIWPNPIPSSQGCNSGVQEIFYDIITLEYAGFRINRISNLRFLADAQDLASGPPTGAVAAVGSLRPLCTCRRG